MIWQSLRAVLVGLAIGITLAVAATATMFRLLPNLENADRWMTVPTVLVLIVVASVAAVVPARHAVAIAPVIALRTE